MSTLITWEWGYLLASMMWGMVLAGCYDIIRVFRRVVVHRGVRWIFAEDMVYWDVQRICDISRYISYK